MHGVRKNYGPRCLFTPLTWGPTKKYLRSVVLMLFHYRVFEWSVSLQRCIVCCFVDFHCEVQDKIWQSFAWPAYAVRRTHMTWMNWKMPGISILDLKQQTVQIWIHLSDLRCNMIQLINCSGKECFGIFRSESVSFTSTMGRWVDGLAGQGWMNTSRVC